MAPSYIQYLQLAFICSKFLVNLDYFQLAYLPYKRRDMILENESSEFTVPIEGCETGEDSSKEDKRNRKHGLLNWFKLRVIL